MRRNERGTSFMKARRRRHRLDGALARILPTAVMRRPLPPIIAGLLRAETEHRKQIEKTVEPFQGLLLGLFFVSIGTGLDLSLLVANPLRVLGIMVITMTVNAVVLFALSRLFGLESLPSMEAALMLAASGEFAFVVLQSAMQDNLLRRSVGNTILVASILSMFCIPLLSSLATAIRRYALRTAPAQ